MTPFERLLIAAAASRRPRVPEGSEVLWRVFVDLSATRTFNSVGPNPIAFAEIEAYGRLHRMPLVPRHVAILREMDAAWLDDAYRRIGGAPTPHRRSDQALSSQLFDAVFG